MIYWHKIASDLEKIDFNQEHLAEIEIAGRRLCIARYEGRVYAFASRCPHAAAALANGYISMRGDIVCPLHHFKFNLQTGRNTSGEGYFMKTYPVEEREDGWYVGFPV